MNAAFLRRMARFLARPWSEKRKILTCKVNRAFDEVFSRVPIVKRFEPGFLFVVWSDAVRETVLSDQFEKGERKFVERFLQPGMTVLDVGAYFGIYSLVASLRVGAGGRVIAFEPSPRQMWKLRLNLRLNRCANVRVENLALSSTEGEAEFFVAIGGAEGFSGLRRPDVGAQVRSLRVRTAALDDYLREHSIEAVHFIKLDVEGGELDFFRGASKLLGQTRAPVILCELQDIRAKAWGHTARQAADFVRGFGYRWFRPLADGTIEPMRDSQDSYEGNFVAVPPLQVRELKEMIRDGSDVPT
jgi:FkbM family methyltransferase